jgi:anti-sigma B factor antagonist
MSGSRIEDGRELGPLEPLGVVVDHGEDRATVRLTGELDLASGDEADGAFRRAEAFGEPLVVVDLRELEFIDSTGLRLLIGCHERCAAAGQRLVVVQAPGQVRRVIELTELGQRLELLEAPPD